MPSAQKATIDQLKEGVRLLHERGQAAWYYLQQWRDLTLFFSERPQLWEGCSTFWFYLKTHCLEVAVIRLTGLLEDGTLGLPWVMKASERLADSDEWDIPGGQVLSGIAEDRTLLAELRHRAQGLEVYRNQRLAHFDPRVIQNPDAVDDPNPFVVRDCLYDCSRILNRYSVNLGLGEFAWWTEGLDGFHYVGRLMEMGFDQRKALLSNEDEAREPTDEELQLQMLYGHPTVDRFMKNIKTLENDWRKQRKLTRLPAVCEEHALTGWRWNFMDRRERDMDHGSWLS